MNVNLNEGIVVTNPGITSTIWSYRVPTQTSPMFVAVEPFPKLHNEKTLKSGIAMVDRKVTLQRLNVVFSPQYVMGGTQKGLAQITDQNSVVVRSDLTVHSFAKEVFELEGREFILIPIEHVLMVCDRLQPQTEVTTTP